MRDGRHLVPRIGVQPGFSGDRLPPTLTRLAGRIGSIQTFEIVDKLRDGRTPSSACPGPRGWA